MLEVWESSAKQVGDAVLGFRKPLVVHHYDCDGLAGAGVVAAALERASKDYSLLSIKRVDAEAVTAVEKAVSDRGCGAVVFVDLGSGQLAALKGLAERLPVAVIDHHVPQEADFEVLHANCMLHGFDGGLDASAATTAFYCFRSSGWDLAELAVVGAVGDMQDKRGLKGLNGLVVKEAAEKGFVSITTDLRLFGRVTRTLVNFLRYSSEPFLPGLTGKEKESALFLQDHGIPLQRDGRWLKYLDLSEDQRYSLRQALVSRCSASGFDEDLLSFLVGEVYSFPGEPKDSELSDASEFSTLLNACGRHGRTDLGVDVCLKREGALEKARELLARHRALLSVGVSYASVHTTDLGAFYFLDARGKIGDTIIGTVIGSFFGSGVLPRTKPIVGFSIDEKQQLKASARGTAKLVAAGLDLDKAMRLAAEKAGGLGGGHKTAAGAAFPPSGERAFLLEVKKVIQEQLTSPAQRP